MPIREIDTVCFIGGGTMGCFNSLLAAAGGYNAVLHDINPQTRENALLVLSEIGAHLVAAGMMGADALPAALRRVSICADLGAAVAGADLVSESVPEVLELKRKVHAELDAACRDSAILTTNTSGMLVSEIESAVRRGDRFAALHSHLGSPLFDIVPGPRTSAATVDVLERYVESLGGASLVLKKESRGYVFNAMFGPVLTMAMVLVSIGAASKEDVDRAWMRHRGAPMGPFGIMDLFGLNVVMDSWRQEKTDPQAEQLRPLIAAFLSPYIEGGKLGVKCGQGFYEYPDPAFQRQGFLSSGDDHRLAHAVLTVTLIRGAMSLAMKQVAEPKDIDRAWTAATRLEDGPFAILKGLGEADYTELLDVAASAGLAAPGGPEQLKEFQQREIAKG